MNKAVTEQELQDKAVAPRVTKDRIDGKIVGVLYTDGLQMYHSGQFSGDADASLRNLQCITICILSLENGFTVTGESACASPENFDADIGRKLAYENASNKIWQLEGYLLKEKLSKL